MPNPYFQFKQFRINQDQCAMKVCTDSCVLGAYTSVHGATRILDIGTGTGLLALMIAQRSVPTIDAVEIEAAAARQATENVQQSPWASRVSVIQHSILDFAKITPHRYDLIICNPPFFSNHLRRQSTAQNVAMHGASLQLPDLATVVAQLLLPDGRFTVLLPPHESQLFEKHGEEVGLYKMSDLQIFDYTGGKHIRTITDFSFRQHPAAQRLSADLYIRTAENGPYTDAFTDLLRPYYLYL